VACNNGSKDDVTDCQVAAILDTASVTFWHQKAKISISCHKACLPSFPKVCPVFCLNHHLCPALLCQISIAAISVVFHMFTHLKNRSI